MLLHMNLYPENIPEVPDMEELSLFLSSLLTLKNQICMVKQSSPRTYIQIPNLEASSCRSEKQQPC